MKKKSNPVALALDLGGTQLKMGVVSPLGSILHQEIFPSKAKEGRGAVLKNLLKTLSRGEAWCRSRAYEIKGVGFGIPGIISQPQGVVHRSPHFPDFKDFSLKRLLQKKMRYPFVLDNDANMAALGEGWRGSAKGRLNSAKGCLNFVLLTLGTGIGGGIVIDGKIFHGDSGFAGELGHLVIEQNGRRCYCGGRGCLEMYASSAGIRHDLLSPSLRKPVLSQPKERGLGEGLTPKDLYHLALRGNKSAKKIWENFGRALGAGIASIVNALDIETVILGGGLSGAWKVFIGAAQKAFKEHTYPTTSKKVRIKRALLGNQAGLVGGARAVWLSQEESD